MNEPGLWRLLTCSCDKIAELVSQGMDGPLSRPQRWAIRVHCWYCTACRRFRRQVLALREAIGKHTDQLQNLAPPPAEGLSLEAKQRLRRLIQEGRS